MIDDNLISNECIPQSCDKVVSPYVGMSFTNVDEFKFFYKEYALKFSFGIRIRTSRKDNDNQMCYKKLVCSREGKYVSSIPPEKRTLPTQTTQCLARLTAERKQDRWLISSVIHDHNHEVSPTKSRLIQGNRKFSMQVKRTLDLNDEACVRLRKSFRSLVCDVGGFDNLDFVERDARNYIGQKRRALRKEGDGQALLNHFSSMRDLYKHFVFEIDIDGDNQICNVFWAKARSRVA